MAADRDADVFNMGRDQKSLAPCATRDVHERGGQLSPRERGMSSYSRGEGGKRSQSPALNLPVPQGR